MTAPAPPPAAPPIEEYRERVRSWLAERLPVKTGWHGAGWGSGSDAVPVFNVYDRESGRELMNAAAAWQKQRFEAGYAGITLPVEVGGQGLDLAYERVYVEEEARFETPQWDELLEVTIDLVAPTVAVHGTPEQRDRYVRPLLAAELLCCQLFSEPGAGSDLAALSCSARRQDGGWVVNGQKIWNSGSQFADLGLLIARTDPTAKHTGMTAFLIPMDLPGMDIRPIRQMTGGESFNEVYFTDVVVDDSMRLGAEGEGWTVALTTLRFEREHSATLGGLTVSELLDKLSALVVHEGRAADPVVTGRLGELYEQVRMVQLIAGRVQEAMEHGEVPGPEGSLGKLLWSQTLARISDFVAELLGVRLVADHGEWGTWAWAQHVLGAPGFRIAGGSDEIQRTIIAERVLGLPREPRP
ncbi:acyl-CoA dehydrogenase family protein [Blastococcus sp. SYSU D00820]